MEGGGTGEEKREKLSFGFSLADEKIKLIDILSEDDDFLVASPFCDSLEDSVSDSTRERVGFRLSGFRNSPEVEIIQQKEQKLFPPDFVQPPRPSFLRRSLAWDGAFFNSPGVLDPDELSFINKGFRRNEAHLLHGTQDVRKRRSELESTPNGEDFCLDWFEIEPSIYNSKSSKVLNVANRSPDSGLKQEGLQNVQALKKIDKSFRNKMKSNQTSTGKNINVQSVGKMKKESTGRRRQGAISSPKPPKALGKTIYIPAISNNRDLSGKSNVKMENRYATTGSGQTSVMKKKSASQSSSSRNSGSLSSPKFSSIASPRTAIASTVPVPVPLTNMSIGASSVPASSLLKRKSKSRKSQHSGSLSTSSIWRHAERNKGVGNISLSTRSLSLSNHPSCASPASSTGHWSSESLSSSVGNKQISNGSKIGLDIKKSSRGPFLHNDAKEAPDLQSNLHNPLSSPKQYSSQETAGTCSVDSLSAKSFMPSGLRPPSPQIGFFDENTPPRYHGVTKSREIPQKVLYKGTSFGANRQFDHLNSELLLGSSISSRHASACKKLRSPCSEVAKNIKRTKIGHGKEMCLETGRVGDHGKRPRNKLRLISSFEEEKRRDVLKNKRCGENHEPKDVTGIHAGVVNQIKKATDHEDGKKHPPCSEDQLSNLSRYFEDIDLNQEKVTELKRNQIDWNSKCNKNERKNHGVPAYSLLRQENQLVDSPMASSKPCHLSPPSVTAAASTSTTRTPLADKISTCNFSGTFAFPMEPKKGKLVQKASLVYTSSEVSDKENS